MLTSTRLYIFTALVPAQAVVLMQPVSKFRAASHRLAFNMRANFTANGVVEVGYLTTYW
jgi:hypothetical protein